MDGEGEGEGAGACDTAPRGSICGPVYLHDISPRTPLVFTGAVHNLSLCMSFWPFTSRGSEAAAVEGDEGD